MTGPMPQGLDPRIQQNLTLMQGKMSPEDVRTYLSDVEHVNPDDYMPKAPGLGSQLLHGAGLAGRAVVQGLQGAESMNPFSAPGRIGAQVAGIPQPSPEAGADQLGLPQPNTPGERIAVKAGENATMAATFPGAGMTGAAIGGAQGLAGQGVAELGGSPLAQMAAQGAVGLGIPIVGSMLAGATRAAMAGATSRRQAAQQSLALLQAGDPMAPVTLGQVTQGGLGKLAEGGLRNLPGSNTAISGALENQAQTLQQRTQGVASSIGPARDPIVVGRAVQQGVEKGFVPRFRATAKQLFNQLDAYVPPNSPVAMSSTAALMANQNQLAAAARPLSDRIASPFMQSWGEDLAATTAANPNGIPFNVVKALRSRLGDMLSGAEMVADINLGDVKRLYGALTEDMTRTVASVGGPNGMDVWNRASQFWKAGTDRLENVLQPLMDKKVPETAFNALMSGTKEGGTVLQTTMRSLGPAERRMVAASVLGRLGQAPAGSQNMAGDVFSPDVFLTKWNGLSPVAKGALFGGISPTASKDLDALAKAMETVKSANKVMRNPSGTASNVAFGSILFGLGIAGAGAANGSMSQVATGLAPAAIAVGANQLAKRVFTNPKMVNWLVKTTKFPIGALSRQLLILAKDSQQWDSEDRDLAGEVVHTLGSVDWQQVLMGQAVSDALPH